MVDLTTEIILIEETTLSNLLVACLHHISRINYLKPVRLEMPTANSSSATLLFYLPPIPREEIPSVPIEYHDLALFETVYLSLVL